MRSTEKRDTRPGRRPSRGALLAAAAALLLAPGAFTVPAAGQVAWDTPRLLGPESPAGFGVYWLRTSTGTETDAAMATWALPGSGGNIILRGGAGIDRGGEPGGGDLLSAFGGIDLRAPIARHTPQQPLDIEWYSGLGAGAGPESEQYVLVTVPMGISVGRSWTSGSVWLAPYLALGLALDLSLGDAAPGDEFDVTPAADVGLDLALDPARRFIVRVGASLGDRQAVAVGLDLGGSR